MKLGSKLLLCHLQIEGRDNAGPQAEAVDEKEIDHHIQRMLVALNHVLPLKLLKQHDQTADAYRCPEFQMAFNLRPLEGIPYSTLMMVRHEK